MSSDGENDGQAPACMQCRRKKRKCPRGEPCQSCINSGIDCYYVDSQKRGAKPGGSLDALKKRVDQLESFVLAQSLTFSQGQSFAGLEPGHLVRMAGKLRNCTPSKIDGNNLKRKRSFIEESGNVGVLPPSDMMDKLCDIYFEQIHPWIPILHRATFNIDHIKDIYNQGSNITLQAITAVTIRFLSELSGQEKESYYVRCREAVISASMDRFSVENLQATIIIAFDIIASGRGPRSWSIVASATRVVEQLGLAGEEDDNQHNSKLLNRIGFLSPSRTLTEGEERRRIFWSIFLMDRFCSISTGWNTSLTSTDVKRRLPIDGGLWNNNIGSDKVRYFNISNREVDSSDNDGLLGGYAYRIEATECLSRVSSFLVHNKADFKHNEGIILWLQEFRNLDMMLVRWKAFLPAKWQVATINANGGMDENLTLAHVTHNTSVLLLHHNVAYPLQDLKRFLRLSAKKSAHTCIVAALEISKITSKFLSHVSITLPPQFALCIFVASRTLLEHSVYFNTPLDPNFDILVNSLKEISRRWTGINDRGNCNVNTQKDLDLAGNFVIRLEKARSMNLPINARLAVFEDSDKQREERITPLTTLASPPLTDIFGNTLLHLAATGSIDSNGLLLDHGVNIVVPNRYENGIASGSMAEGDLNVSGLEFEFRADADHIFSFSDDPNKSI